MHVRFTRSEAIADKPAVDTDGLPDSAGFCRILPDSADNRRQSQVTADRSDWHELPENERRVCNHLSSAGTASVGEPAIIPVRNSAK